MTTDEAISVCTEAIAAGGSKRKLADYHYNRGLAYWNSGEVEKAVADYDSSIDLNPTPDACEKRGNAWFWKKDYDKAIAGYDAALEIDGSFTGALTGRGLAYQAKGETDKARANFEAAIDG